MVYPVLFIDPKSSHMFIVIEILPLQLGLNIVVIRIEIVSRLYCSGSGPIEISRLVRGVILACSLYKETILAFFAHSSLLSEHLTSSFDWGQGKIYLSLKTNIIY